MPAGSVGRLTTKATFAALQRSRRRGRCGPVHAVFAPALEGASDAFPQVRVGYAVGKRCGSAVERNTLKRRMREVARATAPSLPSGSYLLRLSPEAGSAGARPLPGRRCHRAVPGGRRRRSRPCSGAGGGARSGAGTGAGAWRKRPKRSWRRSRGCRDDRRIGPDGPDRSRTRICPRRTRRPRPPRRSAVPGSPGARTADFAGSTTEPQSNVRRAAPSGTRPAQGLSGWCVRPSVALSLLPQLLELRRGGVRSARILARHRPDGTPADSLPAVRTPRGRSGAPSCSSVRVGRRPRAGWRRTTA